MTVSVIEVQPPGRVLWPQLLQGLAGGSARCCCAVPTMVSVARGTCWGHRYSRERDTKNGALTEPLVSPGRCFHASPHSVPALEYPQMSQVIILNLCPPYTGFSLELWNSCCFLLGFLWFVLPSYPLTSSNFPACLTTATSLFRVQCLANGVTHNGCDNKPQLLVPDCNKCNI